MAREERPDYRLATRGAVNLSYIEVLAVLLGDMPNCIEMAQAISERWPNPRELQKAQLDDLLDLPGVGPGRAARILAAFELGRRVSFTEPLEKTYIHNPGDAANVIIYEMGALTHEELWVIILDVRNGIAGIEKLYRGSASSSQVRIAEVFLPAIRKKSSNIILAHNHPSGDPTPSPDDVGLTRAIVQAGNLLDISVLDHLVIGAGRWVSLKERGLGAL